MHTFHLVMYMNVNTCTAIYLPNCVGTKSSFCPIFTCNAQNKWICLLIRLSMCYKSQNKLWNPSADFSSSLFHLNFFIILLYFSPFHSLIPSFFPIFFLFLFLCIGVCRRLINKLSRNLTKAQRNPHRKLKKHTPGWIINASAIWRLWHRPCPWNCSWHSDTTHGHSSFQGAPFTIGSDHQNRQGSWFIFL